MSDKESKDFKEGQQMFLDGVKYYDPRMINKHHHNGWIDQERSTRCGYSLYHWNQSGKVISY